ncbi:alpha/beta hydrolase family protein [Streptomyces sp. NPDC002232]|uniref:alpha/beta hydrolase family protein n=2 Tax=Streptomyces TaxID=1883 RepID=UPI0036AF861B
MTGPRASASPRPTRRTALTGIGALALAGAAGCSASGTEQTGGPAAATASPSGSASAGTATPGAPGVMELLPNPDFNFQALFALGGAGQNSTDVGEVLTAVNTVNDSGLSNQTYTKTFADWGARLASQAGEAGGEAKAQTRRFRSLRSSAYYEQALYFVLGSDSPGDEQEVYQKGRDSWDTFASLCTPAAETAAIRFAGQQMPLWFFRPDTTTTRRPTIILTNGSDGQNVDMWTYGVAAALERGWNALVYDGPGQGQMLFVEGVAMSTRWETVVTPLVDWLIARDDVDPRRIALSGLSLGGNLAPRAAAFETRLAAVIASPGCVAPWNAFPAEIRKILTPSKEETNQIWNKEVVPELPPADRFTLSKRFEPYDAAVMRAARQKKMFTDFYTPARVLVDLDITKVAPGIKVPALVVNFEDDQFFPGQARQLYDLIGGQKDLIDMTRAQGAQLHCSPMAPQYYNEVVFDWLADTVK